MTATFVDGHHEFSHVVDISSNEAWARTWLDQAEEYIDIGDWILQHGEIYSIEDFLADHCVGGLPWSDPPRGGVLSAIESDSRLSRINAKFRDRYDRWLWKPGWAEEDKLQPDQYSE